MKLPFSQPLLGFNRDLLSAGVDLGLRRLAQSLAALFVLLSIFDFHLVKLLALLLQSLTQFILHLEHFSLLLLLQSTLIVLNVRAHLLSQLLETPFGVLLGIFLNLSDISLKLLWGIICLEQLLIFEFSLLFVDDRLLLISITKLSEYVPMLLLHSLLFIVELRHNFFLELFGFELDVFARKLLLLQKSQFFCFL